MIDPRGWKKLATAVLAAAAFGMPLHAQISPEDTVRKIAEDVAREMAEIDRLLLESSRTRDAGARSEQAGAKLRELIDTTRQSQDKVVRGIDDLIDELQQMARQGSQSSSGPPQDQPGEQGGQPQDRPGQQPQSGADGQQGPRRETDTPDVVQQPGAEGQPGQDRPQGQGEQPGQDGTTAAGGQQDPNDPGRNRTDGTANADGSERVERAGDAETWGDLQRYVPPQYQRAGAPEVPAKYRRLHEAFQKRAHRSPGAGNAQGSGSSQGTGGGR